MSLRLICLSHTPLMDHVAAEPAIEREVRGHFAALAEEVARFDPELIVQFGPDHFKGFFYDVLPPFTVGVRATAIGDYGIAASGDRFAVPEEQALACIRACHGAGVGMAMSYRMQADHGFAQALMLLAGSIDRYPVIPIHINCAGPPLPTFRQVRDMGAAVGRWAQSLGRRVLILASGGLSHDPPIPQLKEAQPAVAEMLIAGRDPPPEARLKRETDNILAAQKLAAGEGVTLPLNPEWDRAFLVQMAIGDFDAIEGVGEAELTQLAGCGAHEVRTWVAAYAAMAATGAYRSRQIFYHDIAEWNAGMGITAAEHVR